MTLSRTLLSSLASLLLLGVSACGGIEDVDVEQDNQTIRAQTYWNGTVVSGTTPIFHGQVTTPRDPASGMPRGKRVERPADGGEGLLPAVPDLSPVELRLWQPSQSPNEPPFEIITSMTVAQVKHEPCEVSAGMCEVMILIEPNTCGYGVCAPAPNPLGSVARSSGTRRRDVQEPRYEPPCYDTMQWRCLKFMVNEPIYAPWPQD